MIRIEQCHVASERLVGHGHDAWHLCAVLDGSLEEIVGRRSHVMTSGGFRVSRPDSLHDIRFPAEGADCLILEAEGPFWTRIFARAVEDRTSSHRFGALAPAELMRATAPFRLPTATQGTGLSEFCTALFAAAPEAAGTPGCAAVEDAYALIAAANGALSISAFAERAKLNRGLFARRFQRAHGLLPTEFKRLQRLKHCVELIRSEDEPLAELAWASGYAGQSHMTNDFTAILGVTPGSLRRLGRAA